MALTETIEYDKIEVVSAYKNVQVRKATVIKKDGVEIPGSRSFERYCLDCGRIDDSNNWIDTDISAQPAEVQAICNAVWTDDIKAAYKTMLIEQKAAS